MVFRGRTADIQQTPFLDSTMPETVRAAIEAGELPEIAAGLELAQGERTHYAEPALYEKKLRMPRSQKRKSARLFKSRSRADTSRDTLIDISFQQIPGCLYVTSQRVIFTGDTERWEAPLSELLVIRPYLNCVKLQFGKDSYKIFVPEGSTASAVLRTLRPEAAG